MKRETGDTIQETSVVVASQDQTSAGMSGETAILNVKSGMYYSLEEVGARVWELLQTPRAVSEVYSVILEEYDVDPDDCKRDLLALLQQLSAAELIEVRDESAR